MSMSHRSPWARIKIRRSGHRRSGSLPGLSLIIAYSPCISHGLQGGMGLSAGRSAPRCRMRLLVQLPLQPGADRAGENPSPSIRASRKRRSAISSWAKRQALRYVNSSRNARKNSSPRRNAMRRSAAKAISACVNAGMRTSPKTKAKRLRPKQPTPRRRHNAARQTA